MKPKVYLKTELFISLEVLVTQYTLQYVRRDGTLTVRHWATARTGKCFNNNNKSKST